MERRKSVDIRSEKEMEDMEKNMNSKQSAYHPIKLNFDMDWMEYNWGKEDKGWRKKDKKEYTVDLAFRQSDNTVYPQKPFENTLKNILQVPILDRRSENISHLECEIVTMNSIRI